MFCLPNPGLTFRRPTKLRVKSPAPISKTVERAISEIVKVLRRHFNHPELFSEDRAKRLAGLLRPVARPHHQRVAFAQANTGIFHGEPPPSGRLPFDESGTSAPLCEKFSGRFGHLRLPAFAPKSTVPERLDRDAVDDENDWCGVRNRRNTKLMTKRVR